MKLWRGNRDDQEWELSEEKIAKLFLASDLATRKQQVHLLLRTFIARDLTSTWDDDDAFKRIENLILAALRHPSNSG